MKEFKLYTISENYITWLRAADSNVYSNKSGENLHDRKYLGIVFSIDKYSYFAPLSSPKETDYLNTSEGKKILSNAELLYKQKCNDDCTAGYIKNTLSFKELEKQCDMFSQNKNSEK